MGPRLIIYIICNQIVLSSVKCEDKIWKLGNSLGNPNQWMDKQLPCPGQRVLLPEDVVYFPKEMKLGPEIVLPNNGLLLFPENAHIIFLDSEEAARARSEMKNCSKVKGDAVYKSPKYSHWHNPSNWKLRTPNRAVPHLQQIPCRYDKAIFPTETAYKVSMEHSPIDISRISVNDISQDSVSFRALHQSDVGKLMFRVNQSVSIHDDHCTDPRGCVCGNQKVHDIVCGSMSGAQCEARAQCSGALKPKDHCCYDICGSIVHIDTQGYDLKMSLLHSVSQTSVTKANKNEKLRKVSIKSYNVDYHIARITPTHYQLIFVNRDGDINNAVLVGRDVYDFLYNNLYNHGVYVWIEESGTSRPSALKSVGKAVGIIFGFAFLIGLLFFLKQAYFGPMNNSGRFESSIWTSGLPMMRGNLNFKKFTNEGSSEVEMNEERGVQVLDPSGSGLTFKKLVESAEQSLSQVVECPDTQKYDNVHVEIDAKAKGFENPIFAKLVSIEPEEKRKEKVEQEEEDFKSDGNITVQIEGRAKGVENPLFEPEDKELGTETKEGELAKEDKSKIEAGTEIQILEQTESEKEPEVNKDVQKNALIEF